MVFNSTLNKPAYFYINKSGKFFEKEVLRFGEGGGAVIRYLGCPKTWKTCFFLRVFNLEILTTELKQSILNNLLKIIYCNNYYALFTAKYFKWGLILKRTKSWNKISINCLFFFSSFIFIRLQRCRNAQNWHKWV